MSVEQPKYLEHRAAATADLLESFNRLTNILDSQGIDMPKCLLRAGRDLLVAGKLLVEGVPSEQEAEEAVDRRIETLKSQARKG